MTEAVKSETIYFWQAPFADFRHVEDQPTVLRALRRATALREVEVLLRRPPSLRDQVRPEPVRPAAFADGYRLAHRVRNLLGNETGRIEDPRQVLEEIFGVLVVAEPLASRRVHALTIKDNVHGAVVVVVNSQGERFQNPQAVRVDLAHELAHVLFDPPNGDVNLVVDESDDTSSGRNVEQRARAFAAELLMPAEGLRSILGKPAYEMGVHAGLRLVDEARRAFDTPVEITVNHLVHREYLVEWNRDALIEQCRSSELSGASETRPPFATTRPTLLERRAAEALREGLITPEHARDLLEGRVEPTWTTALTIGAAIERLASAELLAEAVEGSDVHILGGSSVTADGGIRAYQDGFAILSEPGVGFAVLLDGPGQVGETYQTANLAAAIDKVIERRSNATRSPSGPARHVG